MNVSPILHTSSNSRPAASGLTQRPRQVLSNRVNLDVPVTVPKNGNPGIVPPWLQVKEDFKQSVIGVDPVDPNAPSIM